MTLGVTFGMCCTTNLSHGNEIKTVAGSSGSICWACQVFLCGIGQSHAADDCTALACIIYMFDKTILLPGFVTV